MAAASRCAGGSRGFTLVELVAVLVILGVIAAVGIRFYSELRYAARVAAMEGVGQTIGHNLMAAVDQYRVNGSGSTLTIQGKTIPVLPEGLTTTVSGKTITFPGGIPTPAGMFVLLGCATLPPPIGGPYSCPTLPGYEFYVANGGSILSNGARLGSLTMQPSAPAVTGDTWRNCSVQYSGGFGPWWWVHFEPYNASGLDNGVPFSTTTKHGRSEYFQNGDADYGDGQIGHGCR